MAVKAGAQMAIVSFRELPRNFSDALGGLLHVRHMS
jgi:hypothetical protein